MSTTTSVFPAEDANVTDNGRLERCTMTLPGVLRNRAQVADALSAYPHITVHGKRHSQGGQSLREGAASIDLDMMQSLVIDEARQEASVDAGATWDHLHQALARHKGARMAPLVHQSSPYFSVGGSLAVNCHGRDPRQGPVAASVQALTLLMADKSVRTVARNSTDADDRALFSLVLGGYGMAAVILGARLRLKPENILRIRQTKLEKGSPSALTQRIIELGDFTGFEHFYAFLECGATLFGKAVGREGVVLYASDDPAAPYEALQNDSLLTNDMLSVIYRKYRDAALSDRARQWSSLVDQILALSPKVRRHLNAMRDTVRFMESVPPAGGAVEIDLMQEYFVAPERFNGFLDDAVPVLTQAQKDGVLTMLTSTVRVVQADDTSLLSYSPKGVRVSMVINFKARRDDAQKFADGKNALTACLRAMIELAIQHGGSYYLCYGRFASLDQFQRAYPNADRARALRRKFDPGFKFSNNFLQTYLIDP